MASPSCAAGNLCSSSRRLASNQSREVRRSRLHSFGELRRYLSGSSKWLSIACELDAALARLQDDVAAQTRAGSAAKSAATPATIATASPCLPPAAPLQPPVEVERIFIPTSERGRAVSELSVSVRLGHLLDDAKVRLVGDLHGRSYVELGKYRNCGRKTLAELGELVRQLQVGTGDAIPAEFSAEPANPHLLIVAPEARDLKVSELPVSVRLDNVLGECGCKILGDLDRRDERELLGVKNCGRKTIRELRDLLRRSAAGEFSPESGGNLVTCLRQLISAVDAGLCGASTRNREIFEERLGGNEGDPRTLEDVGTEFKMTRERVRQIVKKMAGQVRQAGGPRLARALETVARECEQRVCPLTPEVCEHWLGDAAASLERNPGFYVRVLDIMAPDIPAWAPGSTREGADDPEIEAVTAAIETWLRQGGGQPSAAEALAALNAQRRFRNLRAGTLLAAIRRARRIIVDFPEPERAMLRLRRLRIADFARSVLSESSEPLTPEDIVARAKEKFGADAIVVTGRSAANSLTPDQGFYLLHPRALGLRSHFRATESTMPVLRNRFEQLLRAENRPLSTIEAIDHARIEAPAGVNSYELAQILREDARFIDLGRHLFALTEWGIQEREYIKDLLPRVFAEAGRVLTIEQALGRLTRLRSASPTGLSDIVRRHPKIRAFGFGYFGLKEWSNLETEVILRDRAAVESAVRRSEFPVTFSALCDLFTVDSASARGELLWKTCAGSEKLRRAPDRLGPDTLLLHKTVSVELALSAVMSRFGPPRSCLRAAMGIGGEIRRAIRAHRAVKG